MPAHYVRNSPSLHVSGMALGPMAAFAEPSAISCHDLKPNAPADFWRTRVLISDLERPAFAMSFWPQTRWASIHPIVLRRQHRLVALCPAVAGTHVLHRPREVGHWHLLIRWQKRGIDVLM